MTFGSAPDVHMRCPAAPSPAQPLREVCGEPALRAQPHHDLVRRIGRFARALHVLPADLLAEIALGDGHHVALGVGGRRLRSPSGRSRLRCPRELSLRSSSDLERPLGLPIRGREHAPRRGARYRGRLRHSDGDPGRDRGRRQPWARRARPLSRAPHHADLAGGWWTRTQGIRTAGAAIRGGVASSHRSSNGERGLKLLSAVRAS